MLRDEDREALAHLVMEDDGPEGIDPALLRVIGELTAAVKAFKAPAFDMSPVAKAISAMPNVSKDIAGLRGDIQSLTKAVSEKQALDLSGIADAIKSLQETQKALISTMKAPKELTFDKQGNPSGIRIARVN
jgi:hypothetical protein